MATGLSIQSLGVSDSQKNFEVSNISNIRVLICDTNLAPLDAQIIVIGSSGVDGTYGDYSEHPLDGFDVVGMSIEASKPGYIPQTIIGNYDSFVQYEVKFELVPDTVLFTCTTLFKNRFGITINKPLLDVYVEVKFQGSAAFSKDDYFTTFEAIKQGGSKYASIVLSDELELEETDALTFKVAVVQEAGDYCYLSNISKKLC